MKWCLIRIYERVCLNYRLLLVISINTALDLYCAGLDSNCDILTKLVRKSISWWQDLSYLLEFLRNWFKGFWLGFFYDLIRLTEMYLMILISIFILRFERLIRIWWEYSLFVQTVDYHFLIVEAFQVTYFELHFLFHFRWWFLSSIKWSWG